MGGHFNAGQSHLRSYGTNNGGMQEPLADSAELHQGRRGFRRYPGRLEQNGKG